MKQSNTRAIVLSRVNYQDTDRILTLLTYDFGKVQIMAKGIRKASSKLSGSLELFSTIQVSFIVGRGDINTLVSARLIKYYSKIVHDLDKTEWAYKVIKLINKSTEDAASSDFYELLDATFKALDNPAIPLNVAELWFNLNFLINMGHGPNLTVGEADEKGRYRFNLEKMQFAGDQAGTFGVNHIKLIRLAAQYDAIKLAAIENITQLVPDLIKLTHTLMTANDYRLS